MSMINCGNCGRAIDSDDDPECFIEVGNMRSQHKTIVRCEPCREEDEADRIAAEEAADRAEAEHERQERQSNWNCL